MPILLIAGLAGFAGFILGKGAEGTANIVKWGAVAGGVYLAGRYAKAW